MAQIKDPFDEIMVEVGYNGYFYKSFKWIFVVGLTFCGAMINMNLILALNVPDHWCHVPGVESTNFSLQEWKMLTLPKEVNNRGEEKYSSCKMYNITSSLDIQKIKSNNLTAYEIKDCQHGHVYDQLWYDETIPTQEDWVCEKDLYVTNTFVVCRISEVVGTLFLGQLADIIGRKPTYYIGCISLIVSRMVSIITTSSYIWFLIATAISGIVVNSFFQSPLVIAMEISREDERTNIAMAQSFGWSLGTCLMPLIYWYTRNWVSFMWLTSFPTVLMLLFYRFMIESPRWLISKGRFNDAYKQFSIMAKINRKTLRLARKELAAMFSSQEIEKVYGLMSLFSGWRIAKNTIIMAFCWCVVCFSYFTLVLISSRMGGNPFLNYLLQSAVEIPAYIVGKFSGDIIGRRLTNSFSYLVSAVVCIFLIFVVKDPKLEMVAIGLATFIKFLNGITFFSANLQSMETYPTCLRQTGLSLGMIIGNAVGVLGPYVVYLGTTYDIRYPYYILGILFFLGGITVLYLPETLHQKLPDTLDEAKKFGKDQKFWSFPKKQEDFIPSKSERVVLNPHENS